MIVDILNNKKLNPTVTELFIRKRNKTFLLFLSHNLISLFYVLKNIGQNLTRYFVNRIPNKKEL